MSDIVDLANIDDTSLAMLLANSTEVTDDYLAERTATLNAIEEDDTVRLIGKRQHWIVTHIADGYADLWMSTGRRTGTVSRTRSFPLSRLELVRKGNKVDDAIAELDRLFPPSA